MKTAILGGGLTGLTLGCLMKKKGLDFEVLEKEKECGGLMRTVQTEGFTFDCSGSHVIFAKDEKILRFMLGLLGNNEIECRRNAKILYGGRYVKYPFENGLSDLPKEDDFECLNSFVQNLIRKEKGELEKPRNLKAWFFYTFGKGIAEKYLVPYNSKIWKYPLQNMGLEWVDRIPSPPVTDIIKSSLGIETEGYKHQLRFHYPKKGGIHALIQALQQKITHRVFTGFEVKKIRKEDGHWVVSDGKNERQYEKAVSTIPIKTLIKTVQPSRDVQESIHRLKHNSLINVLIGLDKSKVNDFSWLYIPGKETLAHRVSFPLNFSPNTVPSGKSSVMAEITCCFGSKTWLMKDSEISGRVIDDLHRLHVINKKEVCFTAIRRSLYAYVINDLAYSANLKVAYDYFRSIGIGLVGRFSEFKYLNMDDCVKHAMDFVNRIDVSGSVKSSSLSPCEKSSPEVTDSSMIAKKAS